MPEHEIAIRIAAGAGDGIDTTGFNTTKSLMRSGFHVVTHRHYASRIRGSHTYFETRASDARRESWGDEYHVLLALGDSFARSDNPNAYYVREGAGGEELHPLTRNLHDLAEGGIIVYDAGQLDEEDILEHVPDLHERAEENGWTIHALDLTAWAKEHGPKIMRNTAGAATVWALLDLDPDVFKGVMEDRLKEKILQPNLDLFDEVYARVQEEHGVADLEVPEGEHEEEQVLISGSQAAAYACIQEGIRFVSGYPMTPSTALFQTLTDWFTDVEPKGVSQQVEDEISAINTAIGASHAGAKAITTTSGGGFSLMSEALGLAQVNETPLLLAEASRGGPSTGLPTKPEQSDLDLVLYASQGDSNRIVLAPSNLEEMYSVMRDAARLAYGDPEDGWPGFQGPVLVMYDAELARLYTNLPKSLFTEDRESNPYLGGLPDPAELEANEGEEYQRYKHDAEKGVSPRPLPGMKGGKYLATGNEHNEWGHIEEDPTNRLRIMNRRRSKLKFAAEKMWNGDGGTRQELFGDEDATTGIITWGYSAAPVRAAVRELNDEGHAVKAMNVVDLMPFPREEVRAFLDSCDEVLVPEMNASGQFRHLVQRELGAYGDVLVGLLKYDGVPFRPGHIVDGLQAMVKDRDPEPAYRTVLDRDGGA